MRKMRIGQYIDIGVNAMEKWLRIWKCVLFHEKEIKEFRVPDEVFTFNMGTYKGCAKCDVWRKIDGNR